MSNTNSINVSAVDNELYIVACSGNISYQLCHILSGYNNPVNVTANITAGTYVEPATYNGVFNPLTANYNVSIPSGTYSLVAVGIDWGGGQNAQLSVTSNATTNSYGSGGYAPGPFPVCVFNVNGGNMLQTITV